ncbi:MAG: diguanylate cyclase [Aestuariibacter sp.]
MTNSSYNAALPKILIVDDEKANLKVLSDLLKDEAEIILAKTGEQALDKAQKYHPDLILLDVVMPGMDGFEVISQFKSIEQLQIIPVIFITGLSDQAFEEKGLNLGACDYILKPFHARIVKARVRMHLQLVKQRKMLQDLALIDPLTSIANRRKYNEVLDVEWRFAMRGSDWLSIAILDIDRFKLFNDSYGHAIGDEVLYKVAATIAQQLNRARDFVARYGGEEFVILMPKTDQQGAFAIAEQIRLAVANIDISEWAGADSNITISIGGVTLQPAHGMDAIDAVNEADKLLYLAKEKGRNQTQWQAAE